MLRQGNGCLCWQMTPLSKLTNRVKHDKINIYSLLKFILNSITCITYYYMYKLLSYSFFYKIEYTNFGLKIFLISFIYISFFIDTNSFLNCLSLSWNDWMDLLERICNIFHSILLFEKLQIYNEHRLLRSLKIFTFLLYILLNKIHFI